jgi:hypothetical protein
MTDARTRRTATLTAAAKAKSQAKTKAAEQALRTLIKRGEPITSSPSSAKPASPTPSSATTPSSAAGSNGCAPRHVRLPPGPPRPRQVTRSSWP